jgi:hypothetical protein
MVDAAWRLVKYADERYGNRTHRQPRAEERSGDAIQEQDVRTLPHHSSKDSCSS